MIREYRTIEEVAGPLMLVKQVEGVKYDELGEIELPDGSVRRCRVLEVNGRNVLVQLFESSAGINLAHSKVRFTGHGVQMPVSPDMLGRVFSGKEDTRANKHMKRCPVSIVRETQNGSKPKENKADCTK